MFTYDCVLFLWENLRSRGNHCDNSFTTLNSAPTSFSGLIHSHFIQQSLLVYNQHTHFIRWSQQHTHFIRWSRVRSSTAHPLHSVVSRAAHPLHSVVSRALLNSTPTSFGGLACGTPTSFGGLACAPQQHTHFIRWSRVRSSTAHPLHSVVSRALLNSTPTSFGGLACGTPTSFGGLARAPQQHTHFIRWSRVRSLTAHPLHSVVSRAAHPLHSVVSRALLNSAPTSFGGLARAPQQRTHFIRWSRARSSTAHPLHSVVSRALLNSAPTSFGGTQKLTLY